MKIFFSNSYDKLISCIKIINTEIDLGFIETAKIENILYLSQNSQMKHLLSHRFVVNWLFEQYGNGAINLLAELKQNRADSILSILDFSIQSKVQFPFTISELNKCADLLFEKITWWCEHAFGVLGPSFYCNKMLSSLKEISGSPVNISFQELSKLDASDAVFFMDNSKNLINFF